MEAKRKTSPNTRRRDPPNASSRLMSFSVEGLESRAQDFALKFPGGLMHGGGGGGGGVFAGHDGIC